ncbi:hypothetical protein D7Y25_06830 [Parabacteroides goldsteinii]|mgnify:FL=1|uniref:Heparinase II/III-like C-terminal domain-containing protein n=3 Tax=Tannerellaceae TaxID=2005525 RepID=A0A6G1ZAE4_9BACT|nr:hypothetical protein C803_05568 [Parabacteroides goldsteinii dnLKV18]KAI4363127.1 hypothetical protein C825_005239 [Parabacteroides sp. ASF519]MBF0764579.1 heparinase II/III family protein [Parabacteroides goldsteinii]TFU74926.1 hypothetical protein E4T94_08695 [Parabacteroides sp. P14]MRX92406.1 hypothetical protein [Parabacteroides goldsteinii]
MESVPYVLRDRYTFFLFSYPNREKMKQYILLIALLLPVVLHAQSLSGISSHEVVPEHPRLLLTKGEETLLKDKISSEPLLQTLHNEIIQECDRMLPLPVLTRNQKGRRILHTSREAIRRILYLSYAFRLTQEDTYFLRAEKELLAMAGLSDWNPSHFLDVAEMTSAVSIGYDWLYPRLSEKSRKQIAAAIREKGLKPSLEKQYNGWLGGNNNWNQVCNGGITFGALALYELQPEESAALINRALESIRKPMTVYVNNGAYPEGYGYWIYGTTYNVLFIDLLETIWKKDFGLCEAPGFLNTASFMQHMEGTAKAVNKLAVTKSLERVAESKHVSLQCFNFADNGSSTVVNPVMYWFAGKTNTPSLIWREQDKLKTLEVRKDPSLTKDRYLPMLLIWGKDLSFKDVTTPVERMYTGQGKSALAIMRTSWESDNAIYLGVKGGTPKESHGHMDIGSFVMESDGIRWAMDFGAQDYHSLESKGIDLWNMTQESPRWDVFRYNNMAHNTLTVNGKKQIIAGHAPVENITEKDRLMSVSMDLTSLYQTEVSSLKRGAGIINNEYVLIRDEIRTNDKAASIRWNLLTAATPQIIDDHTIVLVMDGKKLTIQAEGTVAIKSRTWSTESPHEYDASNKGTIFVGFEFEVPANTRQCVDVCLIPGEKKPFALAAQVPKSVPFEENNRQRINEIAGYLEEEPAGFGVSYHNRAEWEKIKDKIDYPSVLKKAEEVLNTEMPAWDDELYLEFSKNGVRPPGEKMLNARKSRLAPLVWAECMENKGRFVPKIESTLKDLISHRSWILPAHDTYLNVFYGKKHEVDLAAAAFVHELAETLYFLDDKISEPVRQAVIDSMYVRVFNPVKDALQTGKGYTFNWFNNTNNWNAVCLAGVTSAAVGVIKDRKERALFVAAAEYYSQNSVLGYTDDGYCTEGLGYFNYGFQHYIILREQLYQRTKGTIDLFKSEKMKKIAMYGINFEIINGAYPAFADCRIGTTVSPLILWYCNHNLGLGLSAYDQIDTRELRPSVFTAMLLFPNTALQTSSHAESAAKTAGKQPIRMFFDKAGVLICRPENPTAHSMGVALKGGNNAEHHNHNDVGSYSLIIGDETLAGDPGGPYHYAGAMWTDKRYTFKSISSFGHPVAVIDQALQGAGKEYRAEIIGTDFTAARDEYVLDLTSAYDCPNLKSYTRKFVFDRSGKGSLLIEDRFELDQAGSFESAVTTLVDWQEKGDNTIKLSGKQHTVNVKIEVSSPKGYTIIPEKIQENGPEFSRIGIRLNEKSKKGYIRIFFEAE